MPPLTDIDGLPGVHFNRHLVGVRDLGTKGPRNGNKAMSGDTEIVLCKADTFFKPYIWSRCRCALNWHRTSTTLNTMQTTMSTALMVKLRPNACASFTRASFVSTRAHFSHDVVPPPDAHRA